MISPEEMKTRIAAVRSDLIRTRARDMLVIGLDMIALVKSRVINKAVNHEGKSFGVYSLAYQRQRGRENLTDRPFPQKNFKRTTRMWTNTTASIIGQKETEVTVRLAPVTQTEVDKLLFNEKRSGTIIALSKNENVILERAIQKRYRRILINNNII